MGTKARTLTFHLASLPDPRKVRGQRHLFLDIVLTAILAQLCGADSWEDIHRFGKSQEAWLRTFLPLPGGVPSADTFNRVFYLIDPKAFGDCFLAWVRDVRKKIPGDIVALDGKTLRASIAEGKPALHVVSAWSAANHLVLGQRSVDAKSNEITAIPELLKVLDVKGCIITIDAMGCQKDIARAIVAKKAGYILAVKGNQERLLTAPARPGRRAEAGTKSDGRQPLTPSRTFRTTSCSLGPSSKPWSGSSPKPCAAERRSTRSDSTSAPWRWAKWRSSPTGSVPTGASRTASIGSWT